jgi:hypothetical protein
MGLFSWLLGGKSAKTIIREGRSKPADAAFDAWTSGNVQHMIKALSLKTNPIDRHFLLMNLFQKAHRLRNAKPEMRALARRVGLQHVNEFGTLRAPLVRDLGFVPRVPTFQNLATLLSEDGELEAAIDVCEKAIEWGLSDGTQGDFDARIDRLRKLASRGKKAKTE